VATRCLIVDDNRLRPDATLVDIDLGSESGFDLVRRLLVDHRGEHRASRAPEEPSGQPQPNPRAFCKRVLVVRLPTALAVDGLAHSQKFAPRRG
jgi:hypothetical protein